MLFLSFIFFGQASGGSFLVERRKILAGLLHDLHHVVEGDAMLSVGKAGVQIGIQGTGGREGVALYAGNLHESANRIAGHPQMVLEAHLSGVLYLGRAASEEMSGCVRGHGACHSCLTRTASLGA